MNGLTGGDADDASEPEKEEMNCLSDVIGDGGQMDQINSMDEQNGDYERHEMLMDSGSSSSFLRRGVLAHLGMEPASKDEVKRSWSNASGGEVRMRGTTKVRFDTNEFMPKSVKLKRSDEVDKTIGSVSEFADRGNTIIFTKSGGAIVHDPGEALAKQLVQQSKRTPTPFRRNRGTYTLDMWVKKAFEDKQENARKGKEEDAGHARCCSERPDGDDRGNGGRDCAAVVAVPAEAWREFSERFKTPTFARRHL